MTQQEAEQRQNELNELLNVNYPDLISHVDIINGTEEINISFFWNRISRDNWKSAKTFRIKAVDYQEALETQILPFFE